MKTKIKKLAMYNYANDNKLFEWKWSPTEVKNICLFENLAKKAIEKVKSEKSSVTDATSFINRHLEISDNGN